MLDVHGGRVVSVEGGMLRLDYRDDDDPLRTSSSACLPDLTDPATLGCLLALVREAWGDHYLCIVGEPETGWRVDAVTALVRDLHGFPFEVETYVAALEAAHERA